MFQCPVITDVFTEKTRLRTRPLEYVRTLEYSVGEGQCMTATRSHLLGKTWLRGEGCEGRIRRNEGSSALYVFKCTYSISLGGQNTEAVRTGAVGLCVLCRKHP